MVNHRWHVSGSSNMKLNITSLLGLLLITGATAFFIGRISSSPPAISATDQAGPAETRSSRNADTGIAASDARTRRADRAAALTPEDRLSRLESIVRGENALARNRALLAFIDQLAPGDFQAAIAHFRSLGLTEDRMGEYALLLTGWAAVDPLTALAYSKEKTSGDFATDTILSTWATTDPDAAIRWATAGFTGTGANPYLAGVIRGIAETDPARATALLTSMPRSVERAKGLEAFLPHLIRQGNQAAYTWIATLTDDALKNGAVVRAAEPLAELDPKGTIAWLTSNPGEQAYRRIDNVFRAYALKDPQAAFGSFQAMPAGRDRSNALSGIVQAKAAADPTAAVQLMDRYPADVTDRVVQQFIWNSFEKNTATAISQISRITDQGQQERMYRRGMQVWIHRDPPAARAWMSTNYLPPAIQQDMAARLAGK